MRKLGKLQVWAQLPNPMTNSLIKMEHSGTEKIEQTNNFQNSTKLTHHVGHQVDLKVDHHVHLHIGHLEP